VSLQSADKLDSTRLGHRAECSGSEEPAAASSTANGFHGVAAAAPGSDPIQSRQNHHGGGSAADPQFLNPGPSCRANKGSSSSIPYIDCSDIDSECDVTKNHRAPRGHGSSADEPSVYSDTQSSGGQAGSLFGAVNGFYHTNHQGLTQQRHQQGTIGLEQQGMLGNRSAVDQSNASREILPNGGSFHGRLPLHSTPLDEIYPGREKQGAASARPLGTGTRSQCASPVIGGFHHRTNSLSHGEMADGQPRSGRWDDGGYFFSKRPGIAPPEASPVPPPPPLLPLNHYGSYSPVTSNRTPPHFAKPYHNDNVRNRSDTDPFILSRLTSTPVHRRGPTPGSAPTERRVVVTDGDIVVPGQPRSTAVQRLFGRQGKPGSGNLNQPVQMIDGSTSSGSESGSGAYSQPLMYGNPATVGAANSVNSNGVNSSAKFSFGSLQLEEGRDGEEEEGGGCYRFNEEDVGGRVFSC